MAREEGSFSGLRRGGRGGEGRWEMETGVPRVQCALTSFIEFPVVNILFPSVYVCWRENERRLHARELVLGRMEYVRAVSRRSWEWELEVTGVDLGCWGRDKYEGRARTGREDSGRRLELGLKQGSDVGWVGRPGLSGEVQGRGWEKGMV